MLLEKLCNADGVSSNECEIREIIKSEITPFVDSLKTDVLGNLIAFKKGKDSTKTVMISSHMDEVGFIISGITKEGYLEFKSCGAIDTRVIISKKVRIGKNKIKGIIGIKAIHLTTKDERKNVPKEKDLFIDIGAKDEEEAKNHIKLGDFATFDTEFEQLSDTSIKAKAIDDRVGCSIMCELIKKETEFDTYFCFCSQEEVGLRGSSVIVEQIRPDIALVIEATTCSDVPSAREHEIVTKLGGGAAISFMDRRTIVNKDFYTFLYNLAKENNIDVQYKSLVAGGNDAGAIHLSMGGIKTASISVPCRYIHSPASIASLSDIDAVYKLCEKFLENIKKII